MSVTITRDTQGGTETTVSRTALSWTSDADGDASGTVAVNGTLLLVQFVPDADDAPTDDYDVTLTDEAGVDVLGGAGADLDTATASSVVPIVTGSDGATTFPRVVADTLTLSVSNAGDAKAGQVILYHR